MIRTSSHNIFKYSNKDKLENLTNFMTEYRDAVKFYVEYLSLNRIEWESNSKTCVFDIKTNELNCPSMLSTVGINYTSNLSARVLKYASTQACGIVKSLTEKQRRRLFIQSELEKENKNNKKFNDKISSWKFTFPDLQNINAELNSICCDFEYINEKFFVGFLQLKSLGKDFNKIRIPICKNRVFDKWNNAGVVKNSFLINENQINIRFDVEEPSKKKEGQILGADQGIVTCLSLSDGEISKPNKDGYDLHKITKILARRRKGSKSFRKSQEHRKNYINWSINQLNFSKVKELRLEKITNIGYKNKRSRFLSHFTNTLIDRKLKNRCDETGVLFVSQSSAYRSQRCSKCGYVYAKNRKRKLFLCNNCGYLDDSDLNAARNHVQDLTSISVSLRSLKLNTRGLKAVAENLTNFY